MNTKNILLAFFCLAAVCGCKQETPTALDTRGELGIKVKFLMNGQPLQANQKYITPTKDTFSIRELRFFVSNIIVSDTLNKKFFAEAESYHLISFTEDTDDIILKIKDLPASLVENMHRISFGVGVDSLANRSTKRIGDLDASGDMAWNWTQGYKFLSLEGYYYGKSLKGLVFHIGGNECYRPITLSTNGQKTNYTLEVEVSRLFSTPHQMPLAENYSVMSGEAAVQIADNSTTLFSFPKASK